MGVITGYGHSPEHMSLYCAEAGVLISGDMLLPHLHQRQRFCRHAG
jgi:glyoxylase-like metal-dependent hydrolase (beta-lactamase superfamily II)